ncbi:putative glutamyl-tRNA amidotransferase subunit a protein [Neofusicoccum parvum]|uniref:Glutamyl-tRNA amidotransferase subunit a protein n=1 Tax=Neofusicoccum parvum TaxID=310453 RepID=A0ACB5S834_9PEZI|nr:putative glutamyl-tRNA amidotransferase subunit a protein [Neofusicoccum parvum]
MNRAAAWLALLPLLLSVAISQLFTDMAAFRLVLLALFSVLFSHSYSQETIKGVPIPSLIDATIEDLQVGMEAGLFTSVDLVNAYVARINEVNGTVHAVIELNPDAVQIARQLDAERGNGTSRGPLHGIPILIKNNIATKDQMNNTAGSYALLGAKVPRDAAVARKLREAGAIILGKTNLSQWANFRSNNSTNGWSAYGGQVYAAYYPNQDPSGSSSGSGVASDLGLALASLGTETDGSILSPSNKNNLAGIKPTVGLTSRNLVIPISEHQDTVGPMARTVKDAAYILHAIAGVDPYDNYTLASPFANSSLPDYVAACNPAALAGARIGVPANVLELNAPYLAAAELSAFHAALPILAGAGATIVPDANFTAFAEYAASSNETLVLNADFLANLRAYLATLTANPTGVTDLAGVRAFTRAFGPEDYPDRDTGVWDDALDAQGWDNADPRFWAAYQADLFLGGEGGVLGALERGDLDAVVLPTSISPGVPAIVGAPVVTVPLGFYPANQTVEESRRGLVDEAPGIPFGLSFLGKRWDEATLIGLAYAFEQLTMVRDQGKRYVEPTTEIADVVGM